MPKLTKKNLAIAVNSATRIAQTDIFRVLQSTFDIITQSLAKGESVELRNFGVFEVKVTKSRIGRNPNKPQISITIPPRATVKFKAGKVMKKLVSDSTESLKNSQ